MGKRGPKPDSAAQLKARGDRHATARMKQEQKDAPVEAPIDLLPVIHVPIPGDLENLIREVPKFDPYAFPGECVFDPASAAKALTFFGEKLRYVQGPKVKQPFELSRHQQAEIANLYGWKRPDGTRRFREGYISVARKNGKSTVAAGLALMELAQPIEGGVEIISAALTAKQAGIIFRMAKRMVNTSPPLLAAIRPYAYSLVLREDDMSNYQAISADSGAAHGSNPQLVLFDEIHNQTSRDLYDTLKSGQGSRLQPLFLSLTTAGFDRNSICWEVYGHAKAVQKGADTDKGGIPDESFFPAIYELDEKDDWTDPDNWVKANPNLGVSVRGDFLVGELRKAEKNPSLENVFRRLYCNQWTQSAIRWLDMRDWDHCKDETAKLGREQSWWGGLDLGSSEDLTAFVLVAKKEDKFHVKAWFFMPQEQVEKLYGSDHVPYPLWVRQGLVHVTPGKVQNYDFIRAKINEICREHRVRMIAYDPWNAGAVSTQLKELDGIKMAEFRQGFISMTEPSKLLERLVLSGDLRHDGNPVLRAHAENATVLTDPSGNIKPKKDRNTARIDGIVALVMALRLASMDNAGSSVYDRRGVRSL